MRCLSQYHLPFAKPPKATSPRTARMIPSQTLHTIPITMPAMTRMPPRPRLAEPARASVAIPCSSLSSGPRGAGRRLAASDPAPTLRARWRVVELVVPVEGRLVGLRELLALHGDVQGALDLLLG